MTDNVVIVGAGHAAGQLLASLKQNQFQGQITLLGEEPFLPYQRPPLSKRFLAGELEPERLYVKPPAFYEDSGIDVRLDTPVTRIDRDRRRVLTAGGTEIAYSTLILATGASVRRLPIAGDTLAGVHYLRTIDDVNAIRAELPKKKSVVIVGAGYIGLEAAAVTRQLGLEVTVLEMAERVMSRVVSPEISDFYQLEHTNHGVKFRLLTGVSAFLGDDRITAVQTADGELIPAEFVIVGVGIEANTGLAIEAGLEVQDGIIVNDRCQTSDPSIYAVGDCTRHPNSIYDRMLRLESVHNALEQAKTAAGNICGKSLRYSQVPWFWSDQYDLKLQIAGLSDGFDDAVIRGNPADRSFACLYLKDGVLIATDAINSPREFVQSKAIIASRMKVDREQLANTQIELKDLASRRDS